MLKDNGHILIRKAHLRTWITLDKMEQFIQSEEKCFSYFDDIYLIKLSEKKDCNVIYMF